MIRRPQKSLLLILAIAFFLGSVYAFMVPLGLPYDEPAHISNMLFYAHHISIPILGNTGVTYEAQQGPTAYGIDALLLRSLRPLGLGVHAVLHVIRILGALIFVIAVIAMDDILAALRIPPQSRRAALCLFAWNPMLLVMSSSVHNDTLALCLGTVAIAMTLRLLTSPPNLTQGVLLGVISGLGVLTKLTDWVLIIAIPATLLYRHRARATTAVAAFVGAVILVFGWWLLRNLILYGDPTASRAVARTGVTFPPTPITSASSAWHLLEEFVTYLWLPTEYLRNAFHAPAVLKGLLLVTSVGIGVAGCVTLRRRWRSPEWLLVIACAVTSVSAWIVIAVEFEGQSPRMAYLDLPLWVAITGLALGRLPRRIPLITAVFLCTLLNVWLISELATVHTMGFLGTT